MNQAIEVDGEYHDDEKQKLYDNERTIELNAKNVVVLRFSNDEVINNTEQVINKITSHLP
jgi:leucyl-tRNA synthetase